MNPVCYFEVPVDDLDRAVEFYQRVFSYSLERTNIDGNEMALFPFSRESGGITGALAMGPSYQPGKSGARIYFSTDDIEGVLARAVSAGGKILYPKTSVGELGWVAEFEDSEGNCIALHASCPAGSGTETRSTGEPK